jgi:uncharacterized membrane protein
MPFCSQCGNRVEPKDTFCGRCGAKQPVSATAPPIGRDPLAGINPRTASILCYIPGLGWIAAIIVLASQRFRHDRRVRFHAFQGLYLFVAGLMEDWVVRPMLKFQGVHLHGLLQGILLVMAIVMIIKTAKNQDYALPLFGELAERSLVED